jgi:hypothetical protein
MDKSYYINVLEKGALLTFHYSETENGIIKFSPIASGKWLKKIHPKKNYNINKLYNIASKEEFNFDNKFFKAVDYLCISEKYTMDDLFLNDIDLTKDKKYIADQKTVLDNYRNAYKNEILRVFVDFKEKSNIDYDLYVLRFYPNIYPKNSKKIIKILKKDLLEKYFMSDYNFEFIERGKIDVEIDLVSEIDSFKIFGILEKNINVTDSIFLESLKTKWFSLIQNEKQNVIERLQNLNLKELNYSLEEEKELLEEINLLTNKLNEIKIDNLSHFKTPKEIVSYWPILLQPEPEYVYKGN